MEYRVSKVTGDRISEIGLGTAYQFDGGRAEGVRALRLAYEGGINYFDLGAGHANTFPIYGEAFADVRRDIMYQIHFGAVYPGDGSYARAYDYDEVMRTVERVLTDLRTDYIDYCFASCLDELAEWEEFKENGLLERMRQLRDEGVVRHTALSTHTPVLGQAVLDDIGEDVEMLMFSINPAYDYGQGGEYARGGVDERAELLRRCEAQGIGVTVMKPFSGGQLLGAATSPFGQALSVHQCIQYALDKPAVLSVLAGVQSEAEVAELLRFHSLSAEQRDWSVVGTFAPPEAAGACVYCNHCKPCPMGIEIGQVNKYYDLARAGDAMAVEHYRALSLNASDCIHCGSCDRRCPFGVAQSDRMAEIERYMSTCA